MMFSFYPAGERYGYAHSTLCFSVPVPQRTVYQNFAEIMDTEPEIKDAPDAVEGILPAG